MTDPRKRVHTLLTDAAIAGLSTQEREELELLLAGAAIDPSYEQAAAAIELALVDHSEAVPAGLEAAIIAQAGRYYGFTELGPREPTLGGAGGGELMLGGDRSTGEHDVLESSLTAGRIDQVLEADEGVEEPEREAVLRATHEQILRATHDDEDDDDDDFDLDDDDDDSGFGAELEPSAGRGGPRLDGPRSSAAANTERPVQAKAARGPGNPGLDVARSKADARERARARALEGAPDSLSSAVLPMSRGAQMARWATYVSAVAALLMLGIALWLFTTRNQGPTPEQVQAKVEGRGDKLEWSFTAKPDPAVRTDAGGSVLWSSELQAGVMTIRGLEANDPSAAQYQLWIVDRNRDGPPVDGGVFDVRASEGTTEVRVAIDAKLLVSDPAAFVITVERPGGVVVSSQARVAMVAAPPG
jgi:anti-sigma-K factor RskA